MTGRFTIAANGAVIERPATPAEDRALNLYCARVYLREARLRRATQPRFAVSLAQWAANARRRAQAVDVSPRQRDLFEVAA